MEQLRNKRELGTDLSSAELGDLPAEIRDRAFFSARVEDERLLAEMKSRLQNRIELSKRDGRTMDRGVFIEEMRDILRENGYQRPDGIKAGSLRDLKSSRRLGLIFDMNVAQAQGYARWAADMTPELLKAAPCYELLRVRNKLEIRNWPRIWAAAGGEFYGGAGSNPDYPLSPGRMIAKKTDPIWVAISRFQTPWPPFDWGSGMGLRSINRYESQSLGVTKLDEVMTPLEKPFNDDFKMSIRSLPERARERLRSAFGDSVKIDNEEIILQRNNTPETYEQRQQDPETSAQERAREHYLRASEELERLQRDDDGTELGFRGEGEIEIARIYLAQISAVAVGRKRLFHDTMTDLESDTLIKTLKDFPANVAVHRRAGHVIVWRKDLLDVDAEKIIDKLEQGAGGMLLGYGRDTMALNEPFVLVQIFRASDTLRKTPLVGFHAPLDWKAFATGRAEDLSHAFGEPMVVTFKEVRP